MDAFTSIIYRPVIKKVLFTSKLALKIRKKLINCCIRSITLYCANTWTLRKVDQKYLEVLKCDAGEGWRRPVRPSV